MRNWILKDDRGDYYIIGANINIESACANASESYAGGGRVWHDGEIDLPLEHWDLIHIPSECWGEMTQRLICGRNAYTGL